MAKASWKNNNEFLDSLELNQMIYDDYLNRLKKLSLSIYDWKLPKSMNARFLEKTLFYYGKATLLKSDKYGFINTKCTNSGVNIYDYPTDLNCESYDLQENRKLYDGLLKEEEYKNNEMEYCVLVENTWDCEPTIQSIQLFAYKLYEADITSLINVKAQKTPVMILVDDKQKQTMKNLYLKYEGNSPVIFGDKHQLSPDSIKAIKTDAPFVADKVMEYKKEIWNEVLTYLGINNILVDKKERLISDEANSNNELINLNLQSFFNPRKIACEQFNDLFNLKGTKEEISVKLCSDLRNIIKNTETAIIGKTNENEKEEKEGDENG